MTEHTYCPLQDQRCPQQCPPECEQFYSRVAQSIADVTIHGNYTRTVAIDGWFTRQTYRNHQPVGEPVRWRRLPTPQENP